MDITLYELAEAIEFCVTEDYYASQSKLLEIAQDVFNHIHAVRSGQRKPCITFETKIDKDEPLSYSDEAWAEICKKWEILPHESQEWYP
jgi:hypothetical protein